ncbi:MAG: hypothetical protein WD398_11500 [Cyclobacteriaceae bacterium]
MKLLIKILSYLGLGLTLFPSFLLFSGMIEAATCKQLMLFGTVLWFITAPFWMNKKQTSEDDV